jgi:hypothetical protein
MPSAAVARYLERHAYSYPGADALPEPSPGLKLAVVIPSLAERGLLGAVLDNLEQGSMRLAEVEVLVLVNNPADPGADVLEDNLATLQEVHARPKGVVRVLAADYASPGRWLDPAQAGVGLARRLGMDLALRRLAQAGNLDRAAIACLDADSPAAPGYADAVLEVFDREDAPRAGFCSYAHPKPADDRLAAAGIAYELWLRYFEAGLRAAGSLFAFPTVGSCTVVSAEGYALADGMPLRQAGEDFHFLRKLAKISRSRPLARIPNARVFPALRVSNRVPFGTGRAMVRCLAEGLDGYRTVEPPEAFLEVKQFLNATDRTRDLKSVRAVLAEPLAVFLEGERAWPVMEKLVRNYPDQEQFALAVQHWFDSLRIVRYANERSRQLGRVWISDALHTIFSALNQGHCLQDLPSLPAGDADLSRHETWLERLRTCEIH